MHIYKLFAAFLLLSSFVNAQSGAVDPNEIVSNNLKKVTRSIDTTVGYEMYDTHGNIIKSQAKVKLLFVRDMLVAAQRIFEASQSHKNYFYYFHKDQLIMIQYEDIVSGDIYQCVLPNCMISKWDQSLANAILASFSKLVRF
jgi:hypothetical protein